jgi:hypothetical protein
MCVKCAPGMQANEYEKMRGRKRRLMNRHRNAWSCHEEATMKSGYGNLDRAVKVVVEGTGRPLGAVESSPSSWIGFRRNFGRHRDCIREFEIAIMCGSTFSASKAIEECGETETT